MVRQWIIRSYCVLTLAPESHGLDLLSAQSFYWAIDFPLLPILTLQDSSNYVNMTEFVSGYVCWQNVDLVSDLITWTFSWTEDISCLVRGSNGQKLAVSYYSICEPNFKLFCMSVFPFADAFLPTGLNLFRLFLLESTCTLYCGYRLTC